MTARRRATYVRFAFCKTIAVLEEALQRLERWVAARPLTA